MSFDQDPNEQANISGADLAILVDELKSLRAQLSASEERCRVMREALEHIETLSAKLRHGGPDSSDLNDLSEALQEATDAAHEALSHPMPGTQAAIREGLGRIASDLRESQQTLPPDIAKLIGKNLDGLYDDTQAEGGEK